MFLKKKEHDLKVELEQNQAQLNALQVLIAAGTHTVDKKPAISTVGKKPTEYLVDYLKANPDVVVTSDTVTGLFETAKRKKQLISQSVNLNNSAFASLHTLTKSGKIIKTETASGPTYRLATAISPVVNGAATN